MLHLHRAERTAGLAIGLAEILGTPLADPFTSEVVAVPAKGVERWLVRRSQADARRRSAKVTKHAALTPGDPVQSLAGNPEEVGLRAAVPAWGLPTLPGSTARWTPVTAPPNLPAVTEALRDDGQARRTHLAVPGPRALG